MRLGPIDTTNKHHQAGVTAALVLGLMIYYVGTGVYGPYPRIMKCDQERLNQDNASFIKTQVANHLRFNEEEPTKISHNTLL